jgi:hypothetical protein
MKCIESIDVPKPSGCHSISLDGGYVGRVEGDPKPTAEHFWVRYSRLGYDTLKKYEKEIA